MEVFGLGVEVEQAGEEFAFGDDTLVMWAGPVGNWIAACDTIIALDCETIVPGYGSVTDKRGLQSVRNYLTYIRDAGLTAHDIALSDFDPWGDAERTAVKVATFYRKFAGDSAPPNRAKLFALIGHTWEERRR